MTDLESCLEEFIADSQLVELCELQRTSDEIFDVINLNENQHSDILAWMLDAREGHGQGDEILRDLLIHASTMVLRGESGLDGRSTTSRFFTNWPPSRIRTNSFGSAFTIREIGITGRERVDLLVIDSHHKFILLVENKLGAAHTKEQLDSYHEKFFELVASNSKLKGYEYIFFAMNRKYDAENFNAKPSSSSWFHLGYDWLKTSADRAMMHVERGNAAASLVASYCARQTDWENSNGEKSLELAAGLHQDHPEAVKYLLELATGRLARKWLNGKDDETYLLFLLQNKYAVELLKQTQGMASVKSKIHSAIPTLPDNQVKHKKAWVNICPSGWDRFESHTWWPVYLLVEYADDSQSTYDLKIVWQGKHAFDDHENDEVQELLARVEPSFKPRKNSQSKKILVQSSISIGELLLEIKALNEKFQEAIGLWDSRSS